ncbi:tumor necrosis factor receptor superfamily member 10B-like, partial [Scleropages formosus]
VKGQFVKEACTKPLTRGTCAACPYDTYTEHDNGLMQCLQCTKCRTDEEVTRQCSNTQNSQCQCKSGSFCSPDQACEFCKKCSRCKPDEETVKNCTSTSNTVCKKKIATSATVLGQESLKKSFDLFEELDINYHNRFFRRIGLKDNEIQGADNQSPADKMYELLRLWMEKEGSKADINDLLEVLFSLDQKLSAETIIHKAITNCDFVYEDSWYPKK